jgi:hypothetical protein
MIFHVHDSELQGYGARWKGPAMCNETFSLGGKRSAPTPSGWAQLGEPATPQPPAAPRLADIALAADLHRRLPRSDLVIVPDSGHSAFEPGIAAAPREATDRYR